MKEVIIGQSGQVGGHLFDILCARGHKVVGTYNTHKVPLSYKLDISNRGKVNDAIEDLEPSIIYLPASLTDANYCEFHPEEGYATNVLGVQNIVRAANVVGAKIIYFSSNYIFDGKAGAYREDDMANPICEYGKQKLIAEHYILSECKDPLIIRTSGVYGWEQQGKNFICRLINTLKNGQSVKVPTDQIGNPTYAPNLAEIVIELVNRKAWKGIYNVVGRNQCSRYEFACEAARTFGLNTQLIIPVLTTELKQAAARPLNAGMIIDKVRQQVSTPIMSYQEGLREMKRVSE